MPYNYESLATLNPALTSDQTIAGTKARQMWALGGDGSSQMPSGIAHARATKDFSSYVDPYGNIYTPDQYNQYQGQYGQQTWDQIAKQGGTNTTYSNRYTGAAPTTPTTLGGLVNNGGIGGGTQQPAPTAPGGTGATQPTTPYPTIPTPTQPNTGVNQYPPYTPTPGGAVPGSTITNPVVEQTATGPAPTPPTSLNYAVANDPSFSNTLQDLYLGTFSNPQSYYDEYMAGQGNALVESTARAMAKSGRTGLLPTLQTQAYQDYMTNYLPGVRKDLLGGVQDETGRNQILNQMYGQQLDYNAALYGSDVSRYGAELQAQQSAQSDEVRLQIATMENLMKEYGYNEQTIQQLYQTIGMAFPNMSNAEQTQFLAAIQAEMMAGSADAGLADLFTQTTNAPPTAGTLYPIYDANNQITGYSQQAPNTTANWFQDTVGG